MLGRHFLAAAAFAAVAAAQTTSGLTITNPSPSSWWVAGSANTLAWTCDTSPYSAYTVVLSNSDTSILAAPLALIASVPNYDCSYTVNAQQSTQAASTTWTVSLANNVNISDIYASTQFEIKPFGSAYPATTSAAASGTATSSGATASSTSASKSGAASANYIPVGMSMAAALILGLVVA